MKALSVMQPWATLIALGAKRIETRSWSTHHRGPLAIHASGRMNRDALLSLHEQRIREALAAGGYREGSGPTSNPFGLPLGALLAVVTLVDIQRIPQGNIPDEPERTFGDYAPGRFAWIIEDVRPLPEPVPAKGRLGLWQWKT